jgi:putative FmdB family regulatory protein
MPLYDYSCTDCGNNYNLLRKIANRNDPSNCPLCNCAGERVMLGAPNISIMSKSNRIAHETNERSRHAPQTMEQYKDKKHSPGCTCCSSTKTQQKKNPDGTPAIKYSTNRPWMISH